MTTPITSLIPTLDHAARTRAEENARARIVGDAPKKSVKPRLNYATVTGRYPGWIMATIRTLNIVALIASLIPSAIRLFSVGSLSALDAKFDTSSAIWMGAMIILISEIGAVSLQLAEANDALTRGQRWGYRAGSLMCVAIALSGNYQAMNGHVFDNPFTVLDTFVPPILALILAMALKGQMLQAVSDRHAAKTEHEAMCKQLDNDYKAAAAAHVDKTDYAHTAESWRQTYANALREEIYAANKSIGARAALLRDDKCDWLSLVLREMNAGNWFTDASSTPVYTTAPMDTPAPAPTVVVTTIAPAQLPAAMTPADAGLPDVVQPDRVETPAKRKPRAKVDMSAAPPPMPGLFD